MTTITLPEFATSGNNENPPNASLRSLGWQGGDGPPADIENYLKRTTYEALRKFAKTLDYHKLAKGVKCYAQTTDQMDTVFATRRAVNSANSYGAEFLAVGQDSGAGAAAWWSADGLSWNIQQTGLAGSFAYDAAFDGTSWALVNGTSTIYTNTDPQAGGWTARTGAFAAQQIWWSTFHSLFIAVGQGGVQRSSDGTAWTSRRTGTFYCGAENPDTGEIFVGGEFEVMWSASDPTGTWTSRSITGGDGVESILDMCFAAGRWWAIDNGTSYFHTTALAVNWTEVGQTDDLTANPIETHSVRPFGDQQTGGVVMFLESNTGAPANHTGRAAKISWDSGTTWEYLYQWYSDENGGATTTRTIYDFVELDGLAYLSTSTGLYVYGPYYQG